MSHKATVRPIALIFSRLTPKSRPGRQAGQVQVAGAGVSMPGAGVRRRYCRVEAV